MEEQYTLRLQKIEAVIEKWLPEKPDSAWLKMVFPFAGITGEGEQIPLNLAASLTRPSWDLVSRGGKRWRPLLMVLTAEAVAGERGAEAALPLTPLVEFCHNASLIHDDIEDSSEVRRGKPAVHLIYGMDSAINSGAFMYFLPLACLQAWAEENRPERRDPEFVQRIWTAWGSHMRALHLGQAMDIAWHRDFYSIPSLDEYDRMCRLKTGCLARLAAVLGVYCAGVEGQLIHLADYLAAAAECLGVGFQILDDVKNLVSGVPGKKRGDDIVEGKKSLPVLLYLHRYPEKRDFVARCFTAARSSGVAAPEVEEIIGELTKAGVLEEAREKALGYINSFASSQTQAAGIMTAADSANPDSHRDISQFSPKKEGLSLLAGLIDLIS